MLTMSGRKPFRLLHSEWKCLNPPSAEPISLTEAKLQLRRTAQFVVEDATIQRQIEAARNAVEADTCRALCWQRWKLTLDEWPDVWELYRCPVIAVESVKYNDFTTPTAVQVTVDPATYKVSLSEPARIQPAFTKYWLPPRPELASVEVVFTAGYLIPFTVSVAADTLTFTDYTPTNGDYFRLSNSGGTLPAGLSPGVTYYIVGSSGHTCQLAASSGGAAIDLVDTGTGQHFLGTMPGGIYRALLQHVATQFADREGSDAAAKCETSYLQALRSVQYTGGV
ncbi:MAG: hypothetical protein EBR82_18280 [Caulobacteraceae bacterium]|nr:hypothetical protein [Caulobacteraceae bacterium]